MLMRLRADQKTAMKEKNVPWREVLQMIIGNAQLIAKNSLVEVDDTHILQATKVELKQTTEALEMMRSNMTAEKIAEYEKKIEIIKSYLPVQLSEDEVKKEIQTTFDELGLNKEMKSMGALMKSLTAKLNGKVDNGLLSKLIKEFLNN